MSNFGDLRRSYTKAGLLETDAHANAIEQFGLWFHQAVAAGVPEANAMALATIAEDGTPDIRMVLLKGFDEEGLVFYTNYASKKAVELERNPNAALLFYWQDLERQVRVQGHVTKVDPAESDAYFATRPRGHQLGAWASSQSAIIASREVIERSAAEVAARFEGIEVPRPSHWGGYRLVPDIVEFWQGRPNRLHDRLEYVRTSEGWDRRRLAP